MSNPKPTDSEQLDTALDGLLEEFGYAIVNHPEASRASHKAIYKRAMKQLVQERDQQRLSQILEKQHTYTSDSYYMKDGKPRAISTHQAVPVEDITAALGPKGGDNLSTTLGPDNSKIEE